MELEMRVHDLYEALAKGPVIDAYTAQHLLSLMEIVKDLAEKVRYLEREQSLNDGTYEGMR